MLENKSTAIMGFLASIEELQAYFLALLLQLGSNLQYINQQKD